MLEGDVNIAEQQYHLSFNTYKETLAGFIY